MRISLFTINLAALLTLAACGDHSPSSGNGVLLDPASPGNLTTNSAPIAQNDIASIAPNGAGKVDVLANDHDPDNDSLSLSHVNTPAFGTAEIDTNGTPDFPGDDIIVYTANAGFIGTDTFSYTVRDENGESASGEITVAVGTSLTVPGAPVTQNDAIVTIMNQQAVIAVLDNDVDSDGDVIVVTVASTPSHGNLIIDDRGTPLDRSDDQIIYTPAAGYMGPDSFIYTITDGNSTAHAAVSVDVVAPPPTMGNPPLVAPTTQSITGRIMKGPVAGALIALYPVNEFGYPSSTQPVAQTVTDADGYWQTTLVEPRVDLLVVSRGGAYLDESRREEIRHNRYTLFDDNERLEALLPATNDFAVVSIYSNALLLRARHEASNGNFNSIHPLVLADAASALGINPLTDDPANPANPAFSAPATRRWHALTLGGAVNVVNRISVFYGRPVSDHEMIRAVIRDLSDCTLDGKDYAGPITFTLNGIPVAMPTGINLNTEILRFRNNNSDRFFSTTLGHVDTTPCSTPLSVSDVVAPIISLLGANPLNLFVGTAFIDPGAVASDNLDGDISGAIVVSGAVDTSITGSQIITYTVSDIAGNSSTLTRAVNVIASSTPVISLQGSASIVLEAGTVYVDAGALANDTEDGNLTSLIITLNPVNTLVPGSYQITYDVTDNSGAAAVTVTRDVTVVDTTAPVITLLGAPTVNISQSTSYGDAGATASDIVDGDVSTNIVVTNPVDTSIPGSYTVSYQVNDSAGNTEVISRTVNVIPTGVPSIVLVGSSSVNVEAGTVYNDAGATAVDPEDGDLSALVSTSNPVNTSIVGTYVVTYNVTDTDGNVAAQVARTVVVADTIAPMLTLTGAANISIAHGSPYVDAGASALDSFEGDISGSITSTNPVDTNIAGSYVIRYDVTDSAGNSAIQITRTVQVLANDSPVITLIDAITINHEAATPYSDSGATASDAEDGDVTPLIVVTGSVDVSTPGSYELTYNVNDSDGIAAIAIVRTVNVIDTTSPVISLAGPTVVTIEATAFYSEPGFDAVDTLDGDLTASVTVTGSVDTNVIGDYVLTYAVSDAAGNAAVSVTRTVQVRDTTVPLISLTGATTITVEAATTFNDPGFSATDTLDGNLTPSVSITGSVNMNAVGDYVLNYDVSDAAGNAAVSVMRTVQVRDTTVPVITIVGPNPENVIEGSVYTDSGATATDTHDGDISGSVVPTSNVNTAILGTYSVDYDVSDGAGNAAITITRVVNVVSTLSSQDVDGDGLSDELELRITGITNATQANIFFVDPAIPPGGNGTGWATAYNDLDELIIDQGGVIPPGLSYAQPTYVVFADTTGNPATGGNPNKWRPFVVNGNCNHIAFVGSLGPGTMHPERPGGLPKTVFNVPNNRFLDVTNCTNLQFHDLAIVDSGGPGIADGGAMSLRNSDAVLDGVYFVDNESSARGGAIYMQGGFTPILIRNSYFQDNEVSDLGGDGGAIYMGNNSAIDIASTSFMFNEAEAGDGGALYTVTNTDVSIDNSQFVGNSAAGRGGAVSLNRSNTSGPALFNHSTISGNEAGTEGGGIYLDCFDFPVTVRLFNNLISANGAANGAAIAIDDCNTAELENNTIVFNDASASGGALHVDTSIFSAPPIRPMPEVFDNVIFANIASGSPSAYAIVNLPAWDGGESHENLIDHAPSVTTKDVLITDPKTEFDRAWYLNQAGSQAVDLSKVNANNAAKFAAITKRTTSIAGTVDTAKADSGFHYAAAYTGDVVEAVATSTLMTGVGNRPQELAVELKNASGQVVSGGYRVVFEVVAGSAPVNWKNSSAAQDPLVLSPHMVAMDRGDGSFILIAGTNGVIAPSMVILNVYVDGLYVDQVNIPIQ